MKLPILDGIIIDDEPADLDGTSGSDDVDDRDLTEDYPGQRIDGPDAPTCPRCAGALQLVTDGHIEKEFIAGGFHVAGQPLPRKLYARPFLACSSCEFCIEVTL